MTSVPRIAQYSFVHCEVLKFDKMRKTVLFGSSDNISTRAKWLISLFVSVSYLGFGITKLYYDREAYVSYGWILLGIIAFLYGTLMYSNTPLSPKFQIDDNRLTFKNKIFSKPVLIDWTSIKSIEFKSYAIIFHLDKSIERIAYNSNTTTSIEIKSIIRDIAESKEIEVTGG